MTTKEKSAAFEAAQAQQLQASGLSPDAQMIVAIAKAYVRHSVHKAFAMVGRLGDETDAASRLLLRQLIENMQEGERVAEAAVSEVVA